MRAFAMRAFAMRAFAILTRGFALIRTISAFEVNSGQAVAMLCEDRTSYAHAIASPSTCDTWRPTGGPYHGGSGMALALTARGKQNVKTPPVRIGDLWPILGKFQEESRRDMVIVGFLRRSWG
jgi:hypothetical protein